MPGIHASISILADGSTSRVLSLNEQLLGVEEFGMKQEFVYCGNIVPLDTNKIVANFGLKGSNGIDIVLSSNNEKLTIIEANPRFQGSMECVERYLGINLIEEHVKACRKGGLPGLLHAPKSAYYCRAILFAKSDLKSPNLTSYDFVRDMPRPGHSISKGDPICSIIAYSVNRNQCLYETKLLAEKIYSLGRFA